MAKKVKEEKVKKSKGDGKYRLPRFFGLTQLMHQYQLIPIEEKVDLLDRAQNYVIQQWFLSNGNLCGVNHSIYSLANFLKCEPEKVQLFMRDQVLSAKIWDKDKQQDILEGLMGQQIAWVLEDRMEAQNQLEILKRSQNGVYAPFISGEVNKAIKLKLETNTALQSVMRGVSGGGTVNIFNQLNQFGKDGENPDTPKGVTHVEALAIIDESYGLLALEKSAASHLEENYNLAELPVVVASDQTGLDLDREGLKIMRKDIRLAVDNYKDNLDGGGNDEDFHDIRREAELCIDDDDEDPEFDDYEEDVD